MGLFSFLFGNNDYSARARRDQNRVRTRVKNFISPINDYGTCFSCDGTGERTLECRACDGMGEHTADCRTCEGSGIYDRSCGSCNGTGQKILKRQICFKCHGKGRLRNGKPCAFCRGTGEFKPERRVTCRRCEGTGDIFEECRRCSGTGIYRSTCRKCSGQGDFTVECRKCGGTGWYRF